MTRVCRVRSVRQIVVLLVALVIAQRGLVLITIVVARGCSLPSVLQTLAVGPFIALVMFESWAPPHQKLTCVYIFLLTTLAATAAMSVCIKHTDNND